MVPLEEVELLLQAVQVASQRPDDLLVVRLGLPQCHAVPLHWLAHHHLRLPPARGQKKNKNTTLTLHFNGFARLVTERGKSDSLNPEVVRRQLGVVNLQHEAGVLQSLLPHLRQRYHIESQDTVLTLSDITRGTDLSLPHALSHRPRPVVASALLQMLVFVPHCIRLSRRLKT